jgi:hypothetical protein
MAETWGELLSRCMRDAGITGMGQTPNGQMMADAQARANDMLSEWRETDLLVYRLQDLSVAMDGSQSYTVGPAGDFALDPRPEEIAGAYIRQLTSAPNPVDYMLEVLNSRIDYSRITLKTLTGAPSDTLWYDNAYPVGVAYPWPIPTSQVPYELHILVRVLLADSTTLVDEILLPPMYKSALYWNLCMIYREAFGFAPRPLTVKRAGATLRSLRRKNAHIPKLVMPNTLGNWRAYNPVSDR